MLLGGEPLGPRFIEWNFVSVEGRIEQAKADWRAGRMKLNDEFIPCRAHAAPNPMSERCPERPSNPCIPCSTSPCAPRAGPARSSTARRSTAPASRCAPSTRTTSSRGSTRRRGGDPRGRAQGLSRSRHPRRGIGRRRGAAEYQWIIDPLDGTTNFIHGFPQYCVSIAIRRRDALAHGVVYDPNRNELFTASKGRGAFLNDRRIRVSKCLRLGEALVGTGFPFSEGARIDLYSNS